MQSQQEIKSGTIIRADFYWKNEPKADGKTRNCVVLAVAGRRAIISPITSLSKENASSCQRIDNRLKRNIDGLDDGKDSWINLKEQNIVYLDGPRLHRNNASRGGDSRIYGQLPAKMAAGLAQEAVKLQVKPTKKQVESDWKQEVARLKTREAMATLKSKADAVLPSREDRVKAAAERLYKQDTNRQRKPTLSIKRPNATSADIER